MADVASINGISSLSNLQFETQYQAQVAKLQKDAVSMQGQMALQLIQSVAGTATPVLDVKA